MNNLQPARKDPGLSIADLSQTVGKMYKGRRVSEAVTEVMMIDWPRAEHVPGNINSRKLEVIKELFRLETEVAKNAGIRPVEYKVRDLTDERDVDITGVRRVHGQHDGGYIEVSIDVDSENSRGRVFAEDEMVEHAIETLTESGMLAQKSTGWCGHEHDCCGCVSYATPTVIYRDDYSLIIRQGFTRNL